MERLHTSATQDLIWLGSQLAHARQMDSQHSGQIVLLSAIVSYNTAVYQHEIIVFGANNKIAVDCGTLVAPDGGSVKISTTLVGGTAMYTCNFGFILVWSRQRQCQSDGQWSGLAPTCQGMSSE